LSISTPDSCVNPRTGVSPPRTPCTRPKRNRTRSRRDKRRGSNGSSPPAERLAKNRSLRRAEAGMPSGGASPFRPEAERVGDRPDSHPHTDTHGRDFQALARRQVVAKSSRDEQGQSLEREKYQPSGSHQRECVTFAGVSLQLVGADYGDHRNEDLRREERV